jgi:hypothetical protein
VVKPKQQSRDPLHDHYALFRLLPDHALHRLQLPFTIGTTAEHDILLNRPHLPERLSLLVTSVKGGILVKDLPKGEELPGDELLRLGIMMLGAVRGTTAPPHSLLKEALVHENYWFNRLPWLLQRVLGLGLRTPLRHLMWLALGVLLVVGVPQVAPKSSTADLSRQPIALSFGAEDEKSYGMSTELGTAYKNGVTFSFVAPRGVAAKPVVISYQVQGLAHEKELEVLVNEHSVAVSTLKNQCLAAGCRESIPLVAGKMRPGKNLLFFRHHRPATPYVISSVAVKLMEPLSAHEKGKIDLWMSEARRFYQDRLIVPENLVSAMDKAKDARALALSRSGTAEQRVQIELFLEEAGRQFYHQVKEVERNLYLAQKMEKWDEAQSQLRLLKKYYPHPGDPNYQNIEKEMAKVQKTVEEEIAKTEKKK